MAIQGGVRAALMTALLLGSFGAGAQNVKITPLGSHEGELCANDRATLFEDPTGVRILYDVGHTLTGADDPRLGTVHLVLLSHVHGDHIGAVLHTTSNARSNRKSVLDQNDDSQLRLIDPFARRIASHPLFESFLEASSSLVPARPMAPRARSGGQVPRSPRGGLAGAVNQ